MDEREIVDLSDTEVRKIERVEAAVAERTRAEASRERHQKFRILFERTAREQLPFVVYVLYMGGMSLFAINNILTYSGQKLWVGVGVFLAALLVPLVVFWFSRDRERTDVEPDSEAV